MANLRPSELSKVKSLAADDVFIAEVEPNNLLNLRVVQIEKQHLFSGYLNEINSLGRGVSVGESISGSTLNLKTLFGGAGISITENDNNEALISVSEDLTHTSASNIGTGFGLVSGELDSDLKIKSIEVGNFLSISESSDSLFIDFTGQTEATTASNIGSGLGLVSGIESTDLKLKSIAGGSNIGVSESGNTLSISFTGQVSQGVGGGAGTQFAFFSNAENNLGPTTKTYYNTPTSDTYLSGIEVDTASDLKVYLRWDGPGDSYMGSGFIDGIRIPDNQITELGSYTRRFEGYLDNLSFTGRDFISGQANGVSSIIALNELGGGPTPISLIVDSISNATPKNGTRLGLTHLKGDDQINVFAVFDTDDVDVIKVLNSGISDGITESNYSLTDTGDGNYTATIPITITNSRNGAEGIHIIARNAFGTSGDLTSSSNQINLDQNYPSISASDPSSYNGRSDGLRDGESTTFSNTISNWNDNNGDTVLYSGLTNDILISNSGTFENPKTVSYVDSVYSDQDNITIEAVRVNNGAVDSDNVKIKIANPPQISAISFDATATSAQSPNIVGVSEVKGGDIINAYIDVQLNDSDSNRVNLQISNYGLSEGQSASNYSSTDLGGGVFRYTVPITVTDEASRNGTVGIKATPSNSFYNIFGDEFTSNNSVSLNNSSPSVTISSIAYPASQQALKGSESSIIANTVTNFDTIVYSSNGQLSITDPNDYENSKIVNRINGGYNISTNNFTITATKTSNGAVSSDSTVVNIANDALTFSINGLASPLSSSPAGISDNFNLVSSQLMLNNPTLDTDPNQTVASDLNQTSAGTNTNSNSFRITVDDLDTKGAFNWQVSGDNLAGITTTTISTNPNYTLEGFSARTITASPTSLGAGLADIGTSVGDPNNVNMENISEGGSGPNGGTVYSYQSYADGIQLDNTYDLDNKFTVCDSLGVTDSNGDHIFNLDKLNRAANTAVNNPAQFAVSED